MSLTIPVEFLTANVRALAEKIYQEQKLELGPILADALLDLGHDDGLVQNLLRAGGGAGTRIVLALILVPPASVAELLRVSDADHSITVQFSADIIRAGNELRRAGCNLFHAGFHAGPLEITNYYRGETPTIESWIGESVASALRCMTHRYYPPQLWQVAAVVEFIWLVGRDFSMLADHVQKCLDQAVADQKAKAEQDRVAREYLEAHRQATALDVDEMLRGADAAYAARRVSEGYRLRAMAGIIESNPGIVRVVTHDLRGTPPAGTCWVRWSSGGKYSKSRKDKMGRRLTLAELRALTAPGQLGAAARQFIEAVSVSWDSAAPYENTAQWGLADVDAETLRSFCDATGDDFEVAEAQVLAFCRNRTSQEYAR